MTEIFTRFNARYLHKWSSAIQGIEAEVMKEWGQELAGITGEQIKRGLTDLNSDWPPTVYEFRDSCLGVVKNGLGLDYTPPYHQEFSISTAIESDELKNRRKKLAKEFFKQHFKKGD